MADFPIVTLGDVCRIEKGQTGIQSAVPGDYPLVVTAFERKSADSYQFDISAVCIPLVSSTGHGKKSLNYVHYQEGKFALGTILAAVIPNDPLQLNAAFLHQYLQFYKDTKIVPWMKGAANVSLAIRDIAKIEVPLPPIDQQIKFIDIFNRATVFSEQLLQEFDTQLVYISKLRQTILQEAIEGKLTAQWRAQHPMQPDNPEFDAIALLKQIKAEKQKLSAAKKIAKENPLPPISEKEMPFALPEGWVWCRLGEIGVFERGKSKNRPRNEPSLFSNGTIPFVQTGEVARSKNTNGVIRGAEKFYNKKGLSQSRLWSKDTLCITIAANIAETGFLGMDACFPDSIVGFTSLTGIMTSWFLKHYLFCIHDEIIKFAPATAQKNINLGIIESLLFPLPPLAEQRAIVEHVERLLAMVDELAAQVSARKSQADALMQAVLREAFAGG